MSRSLLARTKPAFYDDYRHSLRRAGIEETTIAKHIATAISEAKSLLEGKCPKCGAPSVRYVDYQCQQGPSKVPGAWVMYRCSTVPPPGQLRPDGACDFMLDCKEGEAAN